MKTLIDIVMWFIHVPFRRIALKVPFGLSNFCLSCASYALYRLMGARRQGVIEELEKIYGGSKDAAELRSIARKSFDVFLKRVYEHFLYGVMTERYIDSFVTIKGRENLDRAVAAKKGVMMVSLHFGSFYMLAIALGLKGYKLNALTGTPLYEGSSHLKKKVTEYRLRDIDLVPFKVITAKDSAKALIKAMRDGEVAAMVIDGREAVKMQPVRFLNRTAMFSASPVNLALKTGAALLPFAVVRGHDGRLIISIEKQFELTDYEGKEETELKNLERLVKVLEGYVLEHPDHFAMTAYSVREQARRCGIEPLFAD